MNKLQEMIDRQKDLQYELAKKYPDRKANKILGIDDVGGIVDILKYMREYIDEEITEVIDALGLEDNAVRKPWKKSYDRLRERRFPDSFSIEQEYKIKEEVIDVFHFMLNIFIVVGLSADEIYEIYMNKNDENFKRQRLNY